MKKLTGFLFLAQVALIAGCASAPRDAAAPIDFARYHGAISVERVRLAPNVATDLPEPERAALESKMQVALVGALSGTATLRDPGPGVLRLQVTVTHVDAANPTVNGFSTALLLVPVDRGGIGFEARFFDGEGSQPFALTSEHRKGSPFDIKGNFSHYGHAIGALGKWGESLAHQLQET